MAAVTNILTQVQTYQRAGLAFLLNQSPFIATSNTKFKDFERITANLGSSVSFDKPPRYTDSDSLVITFQPSVQRVQVLTVDQQGSVGYEFSAQERIFNVDKDTESYMREFGRAAVYQLGSKVEKNVALNAISGVISQNTGLPNITSGPFRFFGDGTTAINSYGQLAQMIANFKDFGAPSHDMKVYLPLTAVPAIVNSGLSQFTVNRGNEEAASWEIGEFGTPPVKYFQSNLLPIQFAGTVGNAGTTLTVVSTNDPTGQNISQITFSGATINDANAIFYGDMFQFQDGVSGEPNLRFLTFIGNHVSQQPVQFRATAAAGANGSGDVTVNIYPTLQVGQPNNDNIGINTNIVAGMQVKVAPSHAAGVVIAGDAMFLGMPRLPDQSPFYTANEYDDETAVSMRMTYGALVFQNQQGMAHDVIWGSTWVPEYTMRILFPLSNLNP
jgi:hypothetical protein